jgi:hypothetical protein
MKIGKIGTKTEDQLAKLQRTFANRGDAVRAGYIKHQRKRLAK